MCKKFPKIVSGYDIPQYIAYIASNKQEWNDLSKFM